MVFFPVFDNNVTLNGDSLVLREYGSIEKAIKHIQIDLFQTSKTIPVKKRQVFLIRVIFSKNINT